MDELDLHGEKHQDVSKMVDKYIGYKLMNGSKYAKIITGHSLEMKNIVNKTLSDYDLIGIEGFKNKGVLTISLI